MKRKPLRIALTVLLILCIPIAAFAVKNGLSPSAEGGGYYSKTVNRMDISLSKTEYTLHKTTDGIETFLLTAELTVRKCEADLYAAINSVDFSGADFNYIVFTAAEENQDNVRPENLVLRDDKPLKWTVEISLDIPYRDVFNTELLIDFTSGLTQDTSDEHLLSIPLTLTVQ